MSRNCCRIFKLLVHEQKVLLCWRSFDYSPQHSLNLARIRFILCQMSIFCVLRFFLNKTQSVINTKCNLLTTKENYFLVRCVKYSHWRSSFSKLPCDIVEILLHRQRDAWSVPRLFKNANLQNVVCKKKTQFSGVVRAWLTTCKSLLHSRQCNPRLSHGINSSLHNFL